MIEFYSEYASRWCIGLNLNSDKAIKLQGILNIGYGLGQSPYQVLANYETRSFEKSCNFIVSNYKKEDLEPIKKLITELLPNL